MDKQGSFENKIKSKLEDHNPGWDGDAWEEFQPLLSGSTVPFWKQWFTPYLYSTALFITALGVFWLMYKPHPPHTPIEPVMAENVRITRSDTIFIYDTVYVVKKIVIRENIVEHTHSGKSLDLAETVGVPAIPFSESDATDILPSSEKAQENTSLAPGREIVQTFAAAQTAPAATNSGKPTYPSPSAVNPYAKDELPDFIRRIEGEMAVGDTSNLSWAPAQKKAEKSFFIMPEAHFVFPTTRHLEYDGTVLPGLHLGVYWNNKIGVTAGVLRGGLKGEIDDPEDMDPELIRSFPFFHTLPESPDDIEIRTSQWFFPVTLRLNSSVVNNVSFEGSLGVVGNYIGSQRISYVFEDESRLPTLTHSIGGGRFGLSHAALGMGSRYQLSNRLFLHLDASYWLPLIKTGIEQNRVHLFGVKTGVSYNLSGRQR